MMQRAFSRLTPAAFLPAYFALVRPLIKYCSQAWAPILLGDIEKIEKVQKLAVRFVPGFKNLPYHVALQCLGLFSTARRQLRGILIEVYKIINGGTRLNPLDSFQFRLQDRSVRGHPLTCVKPTATKAARAGFFTVTVITPWNKLSVEVVMAPSLDSFKARLDDAWSTVFPELP